MKNDQTPDNGCRGVNPVKSLAFDTEGYCDVIVGIFNRKNLHGVHVLPIEASQLPHQPLFSEYGFPYLSRRAVEEHVARVSTIDLAQHCGVFKELRIEQSADEQIVWGKFKPTGPHGSAVEAILKDPEGALVFGYRAFVEYPHIPTGETRIKIKHLITWDLVPYQR